MINPNWVAYSTLLIWPIIALLLYTRLPPGRATLWTVLAAYLLLPVGTEIKFAGIPPFDKVSIPNLSALFCCIAFSGRLPKFFRGFGVVEMLLLMLLVGPFITSMLNTDAIRIGDTYLPGVGTYDALSASVAQFIFIIPFFLARQFLREAEDNGEILRALVITGLAYSLPMLFEVRMSPQLHTWIYGYALRGFNQEIRYGGFRPVVFLGHGLLVAFFAMTTIVAAVALWRSRRQAIRGLPSAGTSFYLGIVLLLCKTASALLYAMLVVPLVRWAKPRTQMGAAVALCLIALTYPMLRTADLVPIQTILGYARSVSADRAASLQTRLDNEDALLHRALERPWFGWGRFGRNRVYHGWQGRDSSITDGEWIITLGVFGLVGFFAQFGLLALTVVRAAAALKFAKVNWEREYLAALALIIAINMIDLLPNSSISPWTWLLAGALLGRAEVLVKFRRQVRHSLTTPISTQTIEAPASMTTFRRRSDRWPAPASHQEAPQGQS